MTGCSIADLLKWNQFSQSANHQATPDGSHAGEEISGAKSYFSFLHRLALFLG
jgi:hypothetical protein